MNARINELLKQSIKSDGVINLFSDIKEEFSRDRVVRILGGRRMSVSGIIENIVRHHLSLYEEDFEAWRKL